VSDGNAIVRKALAVVRPCFRLDFADGIHGVPHWSRVWFHGRTLAAKLDVNPAILAWFAFLHDSQRHNDNHDPRHGSRAADFASRLRRDGVIQELSDREFEHLCEAAPAQRRPHDRRAGDPRMLGRRPARPRPGGHRARPCPSVHRAGAAGAGNRSGDADGGRPPTANPASLLTEMPPLSPSTTPGRSATAGSRRSPRRCA
jgi:hypothetical protein